MKKSLYTIVNLIFGIVLISLVFIFLLGYSENVSKNTYIFGGILLTQLSQLLIGKYALI